MTILELNRPVSVNNKLVVEAYHKGDVVADIKSGFAMASQKVTVKGLTLLMDAQLNDGKVIPKGHKAYIKENDLHSAPWAKGIFKTDLIEGNFMIVDLVHVEFFAPA